MNSRTIITVGASTTVGFVGDLLMYSLAASKGGKFKIEFPRGKELFNVILLGVVGGIVLDYTLGKIEYGLKTKEERELDKLVDREVEKIYEGTLRDKNPIEVVWTA